LNHSPHRVLYQNRTWPTATHLYEALKYLPHRPELADAIYAVTSVADVYPLSATFQQSAVRPDWGNVYLSVMEDVLNLKFSQHPDLRATLSGTEGRDLVYQDPDDTFWGNGPDGTGKNELGKALCRVRERLRMGQMGATGAG
jgi:ribA/ribD-fused uncharacterized protein